MSAFYYRSHIFVDNELSQVVLKKCTLFSLLSTLKTFGVSIGKLHDKTKEALPILLLHCAFCWKPLYLQIVKDTGYLILLQWLPIWIYRINIEKTLIANVDQHCFNVDVCLKRKVDLTVNCLRSDLLFFWFSNIISL